ncbi:MAG TPA: septation ring formation regulator EzrA [Candidatus Limosilactobacillus merdigallinarum]|uniref:Septation ring formation regulator EzrA n=1 Tax=Candidatus Limosilactobacillus merdigallinarum TaxID=2838652 RepID=A0A9D1VI19_9LACO|nr:septation ring formation regulator EzrA [Candidatus Limosilactobacillus merdigallinarum]
MLQVLIGILIIAAIAMVIILLYQRRCSTKLKELSNRLSQVDEDALAKQLDKSRLDSLMGESLKRFTELRYQYDHELLPTFKKAQELVKTIENNMHGSSLFSVGRELSVLQDETDTVMGQYQSLQEQLASLSQAVDQQMAAVSGLRTTYNQFGRQLDEKGFQFGQSKTELQSRLVNLEKKYEHFSDIVRKGDHDAAAELLQDLQDQTRDFEQLMKDIPTLYRPLYAEFPDQLKELKKGYTDLTEQHYCFTEDDIDKQVDEMEKQRTDALDQLAKLNLGVVKRTNREMSDQIDHLYDVMQQELDAKPHVLKAEPQLESHLAHAQKQNEELLNELEHLSISYTLNNNELVDTRQLNEQLKTIREDVDDIKTALKEQTAVYSEIWQQQQDHEQSLTEIEEEQKKINDGVANLSTDEKRARQALQRFITSIRTTKRRVEEMNLPGIPKDYMDYFFVVSDEISKLSHAMNQSQINMEDITKQLLIVQDDLENLQDKTDNLRDSAALTERLIQYANRLSGNNQKIDEAIQQSQKQFNEHQYNESLQTIGTALEEAEPGSFKRLEQEYYSENKD